MLPQIDTMIGFAAVMLLLSLLITILVQAAVVLFNLRGKNLLWGLTVLLEHALPEVKPAEALAKQVLEHKTLALGRKLPVAAIRSEELVRILTHLAEKDETLKTAMAKAADGQARLDAVAPIEAMLQETFPDQTNRIAEVMEKARVKARKDMGDLKAWYGTVMDRTSERFVRWTRGITVGFAVLLSFGLPIDSVALLKRISTSADLRARLASSADATLKLADDIGRTEGTARSVASTALEAAKIKQPGVDAPVDRDLGTRAQGEQWIAAHVGRDLRQAFEREYQQQYDEALRPLAQSLITSAKSVNRSLGDTQLVLVPGNWSPALRRDGVLGMLMSVLFLSLGAPFWFNVLQQLGNLRPMVAGKVDETEARKAGAKA